MAAQFLLPLSDNQLYSTNLSGTGVTSWGQPISTFSGEIVLGVGLGQGGFSQGAVYAGNGSGNQIYLVPQSGAPVLFATTGNPENIRQILFDPGSTFGGAMIVTTSSGRIYTFNSSGTPTLLADVGEDTEGMDVASTSYAKYAGDLLVTSEGTGQVRAITPGGVVAVLALKNPSGGAITISEAETISVVPVNLGSSGDPLEGFHVAKYPVNIPFAGASRFAGLQGDAIVTEEFGGNSPVLDLHYNGNLADDFTVTQIGTLPNQPEDGIFVTAQRIQNINPGTGGIPEPFTLSIFGAGLAGVVAARRRKVKKV